MFPFDAVTHIVIWVHPVTDQRSHWPDLVPSVLSTDMTEIDWTALRAAATEIAQRAYCPYSKLQVGASALVDDGRVIVGCNVENSSYGLTLCAECSLVSSLVGGGGGRLVAFVCVTGNGELIAPCGRCRQLLYEHGGHELQMLWDPEPVTLLEFLPFSRPAHEKLPLVKAEHEARLAAEAAAGAAST